MAAWGWAIGVSIGFMASLAPRADAQIGRGRRQQASNDPGYWVGLSYGYIDGMTVTDGDTGGQWQIGYTSQIRATFEKQLQRGVTAGVSAGFSNVSLNYSNPSSFDGCAFSCAATAEVSQYLAFIQGGATGVGFHGLYTLEAGATEFANFREKSTDAQLAPLDAKYDFTFGFGGGLGYGFSPTTDAYIGEVLDFVLHPQGSNVSSSAPRVATFRAGFRIGF